MDWYSIQKLSMYRQRLFQTGFKIVGRKKDDDELVESDELNQALVLANDINQVDNEEI